MGKIPTITSNVSARVASSRGTQLGNRASPEAFGAAQGRALQSVASGIDAIAGGLDARNSQLQKEEVANTVAQFDFTASMLDERNNAAANGAGHTANTLKRFDDEVAATVKDIKDPEVRQRVKAALVAKRPTVSSLASRFEFGAANKNSLDQAKVSLDAINNKIVADPTTYNSNLKEGFDIIDLRPGITNTKREAMKLKLRQNAAASRFKGMIERADTKEEIDVISQELSGVVAMVDPLRPDEVPKDWTKEFSAEGYKQAINTLGTVRTALIRSNDASAKSAISLVKERDAALVTIPPNELDALKATVEKSDNPKHRVDFERIRRNQNLLRENKSRTPQAIQNNINKIKVNPGAAYPGVPTRVSNAINATVGKFDVSASYLGQAVTKEYGGFLRPPKSKADKSFAPVAINGKRSDLSGVHPVVIDAATVAGEIYGEPLNVLSAFRSQERQDALRGRGDPNRKTIAKHSAHTGKGRGTGKALDISIVGKSEVERARMVSALVDAGFTGIGQYPTHIHADFRDTVPKTFSKNYGGWTSLSPEVYKVLVEKGFTADGSAKSIKRRSPVADEDVIDYGKGATNGSTSALGIMQFTEDTFLETVKRPGYAERIGIKIEGRSDADILKDRANPEIAIAAGAALAEVNKGMLEAGLQRRVTDGEVYMAHFLGATGALTLIGNMARSPDAIAADLLPGAAKNNRRLFFAKDGRALTVTEAYNRITAERATDPTRISYGDTVTLERIQKRTRQAIKSDPISHAKNTGVFNITSLNDEGGFSARGVEARSVAEYYGIPLEDMDPFTTDEADFISKKLLDGTSDEALTIMAEIRNMGSEISTAALKQIGQKDPVYAYAAGLLLEGTQSSAASDIVKGLKRIQENPSIKETILAGDTAAKREAFLSATKGALMGARPADRQAIEDAAFAHYVEKKAMTGSASLTFDKTEFANSVQAVLGSTAGNKRIDDVNGRATFLPQGVSGEQMENALERMTPGDWIRMSDTKSSPRYADGRVITPEDISDDGSIIHVGNGKYQILFTDGTRALSGNRSANNTFDYFQFTPRPDDVSEIAARSDDDAGRTFRPGGVDVPLMKWQQDLNRLILQGSTQRDRQ